MRNRKTDLRIIKTKKSLYESLLDLMKEKPFEELKVSDICENALVNRSTFYSHFDDKYDLLDSLICDLKEGSSEELSKNTNISNSKEYYLEMIKLLLDHIEDKKDVYAMVLINNKNGVGMDMVYDALNEDITKRIEIEGHKLNRGIPSSIIAKFYLGAVFNLGREWLISNNKYSKDEIISYLEDLLPDVL